MESAEAEAEAEAVAEAESLNAKPSTYTYSKEHKLKRYYSCLRDFMAYFHQRSEAYPLDHEFTEDELSTVEPQDIVNWMNIKMFGKLDPDLSGGTSMAGSHHTLAFYRKGIAYFMPSGTHDWDPLTRKGNPTRSKEIRDLINKVKALNDDGIATPKQTGKKRTAEEGEVKQKNSPKSRKRTKKEDPEVPHFSVSEEVNGMLRHMHTQKVKFLRSLEDMSAAVDKMKRDVETSYGIMITQVSNFGSRVATVNLQASSADVPISPISRSRNLFTVWNVQNGKLSPLAADWNLPTKLTVLEAIHMWMLGEPSSHTPPLQYLTVGHMKHIKGAADSFNKMRRFMKIVKYLGLKAGYWCENWDDDRITSLWAKIWPGLDTYLGQMSNDIKTGDVNCRTLINSLLKQGGILQEMTDNSQMLSDEILASFVIKSSEEASQDPHAGDNSENKGESSASSLPSTRSLELLWGVHHGKLNPLPAGWEFPISSSIIEALNLWLLGEPERNIPPFRYIHSSYVGYLKSGTGYLSKLRCVMKVINYFGVQLGVWWEDAWDDEMIKNLWQTVWDSVAERIKFKRTDGRAGAVTWQAVYNRMHESGLIKEVNADQEKDAVEDKGADQDPEEVEEV